MRTIDSDFLVVGSGIAGLWFAHRIGRAGSVTVITKKSDSESNTNYAQGGIAAAVAPDDSAALHCEDTIRAGGGIAHPDVVRLVTESGPVLVRELRQLGVQFSVEPGSGEFQLGREGGHRRRRIVHVRDLTGSEIERALLAAVRSQPCTTVLEEHFACELVLDASGVCVGATALDTSSGEMELVRARACLLASGGIGQVYEHTTNPPIATGDGVAMGYFAGARVANMEFIQFHPTALYGHLIDGRAFLISEAVRGEGAVLRTRSGRAFMGNYHPDAELAPRDIVARAIASELGHSGDEFVLLDATALGRERLQGRFPHIWQTCLGLGIDISREPIPVVPAAHYVCGGVLSNEWGETSIPRLYAAGECACSGLHGANRLASNSLLEALVMADRAAARASGATALARTADVGLRNSAAHSDLGEATIDRLRRELRSTMGKYAGIVRTDAGLAEAQTKIEELRQQACLGAATRTVPALELRNMLVVARLVVECALRRPESRGLHFCEDHPQPDARFQQDTVISREDLDPHA